MLWSFAQNKILYSREAVRWPDDTRTSLNASFSTATPNGVVPPRSQFAGEVFKPDGHQLARGTRIDAYVGNTRCGVASVRRVGNYPGFSLDVVGPDSIAGCTRGATLTFRVDGRPVSDTAVNQPGNGGSLDLTVP
jgi:hypothetical protein